MSEQSTATILRGPEHAAMERLIRVMEIVETARGFLDKAHGATGERSQQNAAATLLTFGPVAPKLAAALIAAATKRPGGSAQVSRWSKDAERLLRELPPLSASNRTNLAVGRRAIVNNAGDLLRKTALEQYDIDLEYGANVAGDHVFTWRDESPHIVETTLLGDLMAKLEALLVPDARLGFEVAAAAWWFKQSTVVWPTELENSLAGWRLREWTLADHVLPSLGATAAEAFPHHERWTVLSERQRSLVRSFAASIPGLFVARKTTADGLIVEDLFDGRRHEVIIDIESPPEHVVFLGRLIARDGRAFIRSPGTASFDLGRDLPDEVGALLRQYPARGERAPYAELLMNRILGATPASDSVPDLTPAAAAAMLAHYENAQQARGPFRLAGVKPQPPDAVTTAWINLLRQRAAEGE